MLLGNIVQLKVGNYTNISLHFFIFSKVIKDLNFMEIIETVPVFQHTKEYGTFLAFDESVTFWTKSASMFFVMKYREMVYTIESWSTFRNMNKCASRRSYGRVLF